MKKHPDLPDSYPDCYANGDTGITMESIIMYFEMNLPNSWELLAVADPDEDDPWKVGDINLTALTDYLSNEENFEAVLIFVCRKDYPDNLKNFFKAIESLKSLGRYPHEEDQDTPSFTYHISYNGYMLLLSYWFDDSTR